MTQWLSENCLAFARVFPFIIGLYCLNFKPNESSDKATAWMADALALLRLANAFYVMISALMSLDEHPDIQMLDRKIRIFLTCCDKFGKQLGINFWENKGNFC